MEEVKLKPLYNMEKINVGAKDIMDHAGELLKQVEEVKDERENRFPYEVFPIPVQQIITATNEHLAFPIDFMGASILAAASVAIGNSYRIEVKRAWQEGAVLYIAIVGRAGTNKSHPLTYALRPIFEHDKNTYNQYEQQKQEFDRNVNLTKKERDAEGKDEPVKPIWKRMLVSDITPEALGEVHKFNKRGLCVHVDELAGWFKNFNRYNKGSEMEFWLSSWSCKPVNIDRKSGEPVYIPNPFISVVGTIQNGILNELAKGNRADNGFIDRILFVILGDLKKEYWSDTDINPEINQNWDEIISRLLSLPIKYDTTNNPIPEILQLSAGAKQEFIKWHKINTDQINDAGSDAIGSIYSKMEMYVFRLALILEMLRCACSDSEPTEVGTEAIRGAIKLVEYFKNSAVKVNAIITNINPLAKHPTDKQNLYKTLPSTFNTAEGSQIAESLSISKRTYDRFLNDKELFHHTKRGQYEKCI
jgi:hypothetical protein